MSYYKYKERDEATRVNWNAITTDVVKTLKDQEAAREEKRQTIEDNYRNSLQQIADAPQGENKSINQWILNASSDMSNHLMMMNRNLKAGLIDPRDYTVARQNIDDGWAQFKQVSEMALEQSKITTERATSGEGMMAEAALFNDLNKFQQWDKSQLYINPNTSVMTIGLTGPDGKLMDGVGNFTTMEGFANQMRTRFDSYAYSDDIRAQVDKLGKDIRLDFEKNPGGYTSIEDFAQKFTTGEDFERYVTDTVTALANTDLKTLSVIEQGFDKMGFKNINYDTSAEKTTIDADGNITVGFKTNNDGTTFPVLDEGGLMQKAAEGFLAEEFKAMLAYEEKFQYKPVKPAQIRPESRVAGDAARAAAAAKDEAAITSVAQLYYGDANEKDSAAKSIQMSIPNARIVDVQADKVVITYNDGTSDEFSFFDVSGNRKSQEDFIGSMGTRLGIDDWKSVLERSSYDPDRPFSAATAYAETKQAESKVEQYQKLVKQESAAINSSLIIENDAPTTASNLQPIISNIPGANGYSVTGSKDTFSRTDTLVITKPDGSELASINLDTGIKPEEVAKKVQQLIQGEIIGANAGKSDKELDALLQLGGGSMGGY